MRRPSRRWLVVVVAALVMGGAGTYQFVWSSVSGVVGTRFEASAPALGTVFTLFVLTQTLTQLPAGRIRDRYGPRTLLLVAAGCLFVGYAGVGVARSFPFVAAAYAVGGVGSGIAYTVAVNTPSKWIPADGRRGLATGLVAMAYSGTSVLFIPFLRGSLDGAFTTTLLGLGAVVGVGGLLGAWVVRDPDRPGEDDARDEAGEATADDQQTPAHVTGRSRAVGWRTAVRTWQFWVLYGVMVVVNGVGLMLVGQSVGFATGLGLSPAAATTVASVIALADGAGVFVVSGLADRFGGERTAGVSLVACGCALAAGVFVGARGLATPFVLCVAAAAFFRSPVFGIFPTLVAEYYGAARSSENYAAVYTAKVPGGVVGGTVAGTLVVALGWAQSFYLGAALLLLAGVGALTLRPVQLDASAQAETTTDD
ncbi:MFS transporter [Salinigranum halophilum]|uniref:MFS transporter n=1 Tax=Salinigranum halophilum TaxID=2565931 RepID=UPI0010A81079|nr:MFS transporter [Salinigranum halophilum]